MKQVNSRIEIGRLVSRFLEGKLSPEESERLERWKEQSEGNRRIWRRLTDPGYLKEHLTYWEAHDASDEYPAPLDAISSPRRNLYRRMLKYAAIGLGLLAVGFAARHYSNRPSERYVQTRQNEENVQRARVMPRGRVAQLVLGNGSVVNLNDSLATTLTEKDGTKVHNGGKMLSYSATRGDRAPEVYNTLIVPRGGEYQVTLCDGTKVWLNAASSLKYPTRFEGKERRVLLSGEAYFEVATDARHPFIVEAGNARVKVLGTKFDVSAYDDDRNERVALAEGSVKVDALDDAQDSALLRPGYGAVLRKTGGDIRVDPVNIEAALAWKDGMFLFDSESLGSIMKKLSRWYDVDVEYENGVDTLFHFTGRIKRFENISGILHLMEMTGKLKFHVSGNELIVRAQH